MGGLPHRKSLWITFLSSFFPLLFGRFLPYNHHAKKTLIPYARNLKRQTDFRYLPGAPDEDRRKHKHPPFRYDVFPGKLRAEVP